MSNSPNRDSRGNISPIQEYPARDVTIHSGIHLITPHCLVPRPRRGYDHGCIVGGDFTEVRAGLHSNMPDLVLIFTECRHDPASCLIEEMTIRMP